MSRDTAAHSLAAVGAQEWGGNGEAPLDAEGVEERLHCCLQTKGTLESAEYWRSLCPWLHVTIPDEDSDPHLPLKLPTARLEELQKKMQRDGYLVLEPEELQWGVDIDGLRRGVQQLRNHGWQATFITMYDEGWLLAHHLSEVLEHVAGGPVQLNCDWLAYHVLPPGEAGMPPHRDFEHCPRSSWFDDERTLPRIVTCWISLSDVGPNNSCLYVLPAHKDRAYRDDTIGGVGETACDVFNTNEAFQDIVALPMKAGSAVIFSHRVFHWGSSSTPNALHPRVALAFGASDPDFKEPYLPEGQLPLPSLAMRLALNAGQMIIYNKRHEGPWPLSHDIKSDFATLATLFQCFREKMEAIDETYARTVFSSPVLPALQKFILERQERERKSSMVMVEM